MGVLPAVAATITTSSPITGTIFQRPSPESVTPSLRRRLSTLPRASPL